MNIPYITGDKVKAEYKSGLYIGEVIQVKSDRGRAVVKVLAVLKHPAQGDLHRPFEVDVPIFHQRRALAYGEMVNIPFAYLTPHQGKIPDYSASLRAALEEEIEALTLRDSAWAKQALHHLEELKKEYQL